MSPKVQESTHLFTPKQWISVVFIAPLKQEIEHEYPVFVALKKAPSRVVVIVFTTLLVH